MLYVYKYFVKNTFWGRQAALNYVLYVKFERDIFKEEYQ